MTLAEKIRELRAERGMSQEALAERLHVSRQAVTKWETGAGVPDVDNLLALADAFGLTLDELLGRAPTDPAAIEAQLDSALGSWGHDAPGTSRTEYDIDCPKHYDINLGGARRVLLRGIAGEKLRVQLSMPGRDDVASRFKVRIDDNRESIDVDVHRCAGATETEARENLEVELGIPADLLLHVELATNADNLVVYGLGEKAADPISEKPSEEPLSVELGGRLQNLVLDEVHAHVAVDCNADLLIECPSGLPPRLDVNQLHGTSTLLVPPQTQLFSQVKGLGNRILVQEGVDKAETPENGVPLLELNGVRSELTVAVAPSAAAGAAVPEAQ